MTNSEQCGTTRPCKYLLDMSLISLHSILECSEVANIRWPTPSPRRNMASILTIWTELTIYSLLLRILIVLTILRLNDCLSSGISHQPNMMKFLTRHSECDNLVSWSPFASFVILDTICNITKCPPMIYQYD